MKSCVLTQAGTTIFLNYEGMSLQKKQHGIRFPREVIMRKLAMVLAVVAVLFAASGCCVSPKGEDRLRSIIKS